MTTTLLRAVIVGASSLLGKELAEELNQTGGTVWDLTLLDVGDSAGQMAAAGEEALLIQPLTLESFVGADVVFFAAGLPTTREHWRHAIAAGAAVVDVTGALTGERGVMVRAPLLAGVGVLEPRLDLATEAVVACHATSLMLAYVGARLQGEWAGRARMAATVLLPASEQGKDGMDEMHAQTVALLSFQTLPREVYDAQVTFNLNARFGPSARVSLGELSARITGEVEALLGSETADRCAFQCVQAPVFHGCSASIFLEFDEAVSLADVESALRHPMLLNLCDGDEAPPSHATANEEEAMQATLRADRRSPGRGMWLWLVADNLRLAARNAVACAGELLTRRPAGRVQ